MSIIETSIAICSVIKNKLIYYFTNFFYYPEQPQRLSDTNVSNYQKLTYPITQITDTIFLGNSVNAASWTSLYERNIKYIINVSNEIPNFFENYITYYKISINDNENESILLHIQPFLEYMDTINIKEGNVFFHCFVGCSRSVAFLIAYLVHTRNTSVEEAYEIIISYRPIININEKFYNELLTYFNSDN